MERITFENYRSHPAINQSLLKALAGHPENAKSDERLSWSDGLEFGDVIDKLLFTPDEFNEEYYVTDMDNLPSDSIKKIIELVVENTKEGKSVAEEDILKAAETVGYGQSWNPSTVIRKIREGNGFEYGKQLLEARGKKTLSIENHMKMVSAVEVLKEHMFTRDIISSKLPEHMERQTQVAVMAPSHRHDVWYKGLLDLMIIDHNKKVIHPFDIKSTGSDPLRFQGAFMKFRYDLQAALYTYILEMIIAECGEGADPSYYGLDFNADGYVVDNFTFIVVGNNDVTRPLRFKCTTMDLDAGLEGGTTTLGYEYKGVFQLTEELLWHQKYDKWDYPYEVYENEGELLVDVY